MFSHSEIFSDVVLEAIALPRGTSTPRGSFLLPRPRLNLDVLLEYASKSKLTLTISSVGLLEIRCLLTW